MATFNKFYSFSEAVYEKVHNLGSDSLKVALTNTLPVATNTVLANITEVAYTNCSTRAVTQASSAQTTGTYKLVLNDLILTATGTVGPFRYIVLYNDTATNDELIGWFDYGVSVTLANTDTFTIDFAGVTGALTHV